MRQSHREDFNTSDQNEEVPEVQMILLSHWPLNIHQADIIASSELITNGRSDAHRAAHREGLHA